MSKKEWTIIGVLGTTVIVVFLCMGCLVLGLFARTPTQSSPAVVEVVITTTPDQPARSNTQLIDTPTPVLIPTETPRPTNTPAPTSRPKPTNTLIPPTKIPAPLVFKGRGDSVVDANDPYPVAIVHITGNAESRFFAVTNYDSAGNQIDLLVNTTEPYDGVRPLDFGADEHTTRFQVQSSGSWTIQILPVTAARQLNVPGTVKGRGDDVLHLMGGTPDLAQITGNASRRFFAIEGYGNSVDLLVNTTDPYSGTVILDPATVALVVSATGDWTLEVTGK